MSNKTEHPFIEIHVIQSFAVSALNRDEGNVPKWCTFGGVRRARVSSQSWKYAMRHNPLFKETTGQEISARTKFLERKIKENIGDGQKPEEVDIVVPSFITKYSGGTKTDKNGQLITKVLLFLSVDEMKEISDALQAKWQILYTETSAEKAAQDAKEAEKKNKRGKKSTKTAPLEGESTNTLLVEEPTESEASIEPDKTEMNQLVKQFQKQFGRRVSAADIALFGRMLAEGNEAKKIEAACQVAHPISTHYAELQDDFYTAMDDLQTADDVGGGAMIGNLDFTTPCLYRYGRLDWQELKSNLEPRQDLVRPTAEAFLQTFIRAVPSARQNSMASPTPPSFVMVVVRSRGEAWSLANAFEMPIEQKNGSGIVAPSIKALDEQWELVSSGYDDQPSTISKVFYMIKTRENVDLSYIPKSAGEPMDNANQLVQSVMDVIAPATGI